MRAVATGRITVVTYEGLQFALACGVDVWDYAESYALQRWIAEEDAPAQQQRLVEALIARQWATEIAHAECFRFAGAKFIQCEEPKKPADDYEKKSD
jgi:hypothetical protein